MPVTDEFALLEVLRPLMAGGPDVLLGPGDDAALVRVHGSEVVAAADALVDGVHVDLAFSDLADLGFKALSVNVSDLVAVGARPTGALVSLLRPPDLGEAGARRLYTGLAEAAEELECPLLGGDVVSAPVLAVAVSVLGEPAEPGFVLRRAGAALGEVVVVVGPLGLAAAGLALWRDGAHGLLADHPTLSEAHRRPRALLPAVGALLAARPTAGIDVSDGLGRDLGHLAAASGVRVRLERTRVPVAGEVVVAAAHLGVDPLDLVLGGGDDYSLALTLPGGRVDRLRDALAPAGLTARVVGEVVEGSGVGLDGRDIATLGWEHE